MSGQVNDEISLKEIILKGIEWSRYFLLSWKLIVCISLLCACLGLIIALFDKPIYTAELTLALEDKGSGGGSYAGLASQFGLDIGGGGGGAFNGENNIELLKSRYLVERTLLTPVVINGKEDLLVNRYLEFNKLSEKWAKNPTLANVKYVINEPRNNFGIAKDSVLHSIYKEVKTKGLSVTKIDKKLAIIKVVFKSKDELFAKLFTEVLVKTASEFYVQTKTKKSKSNLDILQHRLDSVKRELDREIYGAALSKDKNMNTIRAEGNIQSAKKQLNVQVLTTMYGELIKNTELAKYTLMRDEPLIQIIDTPILPLEKQKKGKLVSLILGGFLGGFLTVFYLWLIRMKSILMGLLQ